MTAWLLGVLGFAAVVILVSWAAARVGRGRDPYDSMGPVEGHREIRYQNHDEER